MEGIRENRTTDTEFLDLLDDMGIFGYTDIPISKERFRKEFLHFLMEALVEDVNTREYNAKN